MSKNGMKISLDCPFKEKQRRRKISWNFVNRWWIKGLLSDEIFIKKIQDWLLEVSICENNRKRDNCSRGRHLVSIFFFGGGWHPPPPAWTKRFERGPVIESVILEVIP
jgi:hypothetical protein